jgi:CRISPR/Cas system CSM-associated protein Csm4 (group 5 of RAMP superfamily)
MKINLRYLPFNLTSKDRKKQVNMLQKSRKLYKKHKYFTRKNLKSYKSKKSRFVVKAQKMYTVSKIGATNELSRATGCTRKSLKKIINKGEGAYYSSGSRPNQTSKSWGIARLASAITSGKAAVIDYNILEDGCDKNSKALLLAKKARKKYGTGTQHVPKVTV